MPHQTWQNLFPTLGRLIEFKSAVALLVVGILWAVQVDRALAGPAESCDGPVARYDVRYRGDAVFEVRARFSRPSQKVELFHFPVPDRPEGQAASVFELKAFAQGGAPVSVRYAGEGAWVFGGSGAVDVRYALRADHAGADWGKGGPGKDEVADVFDDTYVFAGHAFFLQDWDLPRCAVDVRFDLPKGWTVTAPWPGKAGGFQIRDAWSLGQNMFAVGRAVPRRSQVGGLTLTWIYDQRLAEVLPTLETLLSDLPATYTDFWGGAPGDAYTVFLMTDAMSDGGAFRESFAMRLAVPLSKADQLSWSHTLGHELMHIWNNLGKGPKGNVPELEWVNEGWTDYLTIKLRSRAGQLEPGMLEQRVANLIRRYRLSMASPVKGLAEAGANKQVNWQRVYGGGALAALILDGELSQKDPKAFAEALQALKRDRGQGYSADTFMQALDAHTDNKATEIVAWLDKKPSDAELIARLKRIGLDLSTFGPDEVYVRFSDCGSPGCVPAFLR
ncbi:MAG: hypothetical protein ACK41P_04615 [Asticcacaulis sp.]